MTLQEYFFGWYVTFICMYRFLPYIFLAIPFSIAIMKLIKIKI